MRILIIGGTGEISLSCAIATQAAGHDVTILNRGFSVSDVALGVEKVVGDLASDDPYQAIGRREFDVVCQFLAFKPELCARDVQFFSGRCRQYVFISSASAYQKPDALQPITERTPLENPFWEYSRSKAACEKFLLQAHAEGQMSVTVVRPSHTYRTRLPSTLISGDHLAWRIVNGKQIVVHGDGNSPWTLTHSDDFAKGLLGVFGTKAAFGECYHITDNVAHSWNQILQTVGSAMGQRVSLCPVPLKDLIEFEPEWVGPLLGDKANPMVFDNRKISGLSDGWSCKTSLEDGVDRAWNIVSQRLSGGYEPDPKIDALVDRIVEEHG